MRGTGQRGRSDGTNRAEKGVPEVIFIHPDGRREAVPAEDGQSIMQAATNAGVDGVIGECGGSLSCATCHVFVDEAWASRAPPRSDLEEDMLDAAAVEPTRFSRLSCQIKFAPDIDGIVVRIPTMQR